MKKLFLSFVVYVILASNLSAQNVGIGTTTPAYPLDVVGPVHSSTNGYFDGYVGIGTTSPSYKLQVTDGSVAIYNTADSKMWYFNYSSSGNYFQLSESGVARVAVANGGNVGIGTTTPAVKLDVSGDANVSGALTVNGNKGIVYNLTGSTPVKYYTRTAAFTIASLPAHTLSAEGAIGFIGGFSAPPQVFVGNITSNSSTAGPLYQLQLVIYNVTANGCKCRLLNTSNSAITQDCTWNIMCIGN